MYKEKRTRAQGTIVSEMLVLMIGILIASLVLLWSLTSLSTSQASYSEGVAVSNAKLVEQISIDNVNFGADTIYVRNYGDNTVRIVTVYVNGEEMTITPTTISSRDSQPIVTTESLPQTGTHSIRVATERGTTYEEIFQAP